MKRFLIQLLILAILVVAGLFAFAWSGYYNVAADVPHTAPVKTLLQTLRERSIARRAADIESPADLYDAERVRRGAGNYDAMCVGCHLRPGRDTSEFSHGLYPAPPNLARRPIESPAKAFWVVKHGIKASGMPAWGHSMEDRYIWDMVAFMRAMPTMDADGYRDMVAASDGHSHGGGEDHTHDHHLDQDQGRQDVHRHDEGHEHPEPDAATDQHEHDGEHSGPADGSVHVHADGSRHVHANSPKRSDAD